MRHRSIFTMVIVASLLSVQSTFAASPEPPEEPKINCKAEFGKLRATYNALKSVRRAFPEAWDQFFALTARGNKQMSSYKELRAKDKMDDAKLKAEALDKLWKRAGGQQQHLRSLVRTGRARTNAWCSGISRFRQIGCAPPAGAVDLCNKQRRLWQARANKKAVTSNQFSNTWRGPEDYKFEKKAAPKPCPVNVTEGGEENPAAGAPPGLVTAIKGRAILATPEVGLRNTRLKVGMKLRAGDIIAVDFDNQVKLEVYGKPISISGKIKFEIPSPPDSQAYEPSLAEKARKIGREALGGSDEWHKANEAARFRGMTATCGVRG